MGPLGLPELVVIFVVALIMFGPRKLPELGRSLGKSLSEFKRASNELRSTLDQEIRLEDRKTPAKPASRPAAASTGKPGDGASPAETSSNAEGQTPAAEDSIASPAPSETVARGGQGA